MWNSILLSTGILLFLYLSAKHVLIIRQYNDARTYTENLLQEYLHHFHILLGKVSSPSKREKEIEHVLFILSTENRVSTERNYDRVFGILEEGEQYLEELAKKKHAPEDFRTLAFRLYTLEKSIIKSLGLLEVRRAQKVYRRLSPTFYN
jgi:hypothetical protein